MSDHEPMLPVSADRPCPACGKPDWCLIREDGKKGICSRVQSPHKAGDAGWFHVYEDEPLPPKANSRRKAKSAKTAAPTPATSAPPVDRPHKVGKNKLPPSHWQADVERFAARVTPEHLATIAGTLGVPPSALSSFPLVGFCGVVNMLPTFSCPETDAGGKVVGYVERFPKGNGREVQGKYLEKITPTGSDRGLTIPADLAERSGPLFCVEAFSDTVAMTAAGLACVGRPFNNGGVELLTEFYRGIPLDRTIVIVGEHDRKPDGRWPGKEGMEVIAAHLTRELKRPILTALPPDGAKDVRAWLTDPARGETPWAERGAELSAKLMAVATTVEPPSPPTPTATPSAPSSPGDSSPDPAKWNRGPENPDRLADGFLASVSPAGSPLRLRYWKEQFCLWSAGAYRTQPDDDFRASVTRWVCDEMRRVHALELAVWEAKSADGRGPRPQQRSVHQGLITNVVGILKGFCLVPHTVVAPAWLDGFRGPDPSGIACVRNGLVDVATGELLPLNPSYFTFAVAPFEYDPVAAEPADWIRFLDSVWGHDPESIAALQEWLGYLLTADTRMDKMLYILGPTRAGKGTIGTVIEHLVGAENVVNPDLFDLTERFGLAPMFDKSIAMLSDSRLKATPEQKAKIISKLLRITGQDRVMFDRKNKSMLNQKLSTRFVLMSNNLPDVGEDSEAFHGRIVLLCLTRSFKGKEDRRLKDRLTRPGQLAGIFNWALVGLRRLVAREQFIQPKSANTRLRAMRKQGGEVADFVSQWCRLSPRESVPKTKLYEAWKKWSDGQGVTKHLSVNKFATLLYSVSYGIDESRIRDDGRRVQAFTGIGLLNEYERDGDGGEDDGSSDDESDVVSVEQPLVHGQGPVRVPVRVESDKNPMIFRGGQDGQGTLSSSQNRGDKTLLDMLGVHTGNGMAASRPTTLTILTNPEISGKNEEINPDHNPDHNPDRVQVVVRQSEEAAAAVKLGKTWLYVSKKLDLTTLPESSLPTVQLGPTLYHRITPAVVVWLEHAVADRDEAGGFAPDEVHAVITAQTAIYTFARERFADGELDAARKAGPQPLPDAVPEPDSVS